MNSGQGSIVKSPKARPQTPAPPFDPTSADNGLSIDPISGKIVLGNDFFGIPDAQLLSIREIPLNGFQLWMTDIATNFLMQFASGGIVALDTVNSNRSEINAGSPGAFLSVESDSALSNPPSLFLIDLAVIPHDNATLKQDGTEFSISATNGNRKMLALDTPLALYRMGDLDLGLNGSILTNDDNTGLLDYSNVGLTAAYSINGNPGVSGTIDLTKTATVEGGIITSIV